MSSPANLNAPGKAELRPDSDSFTSSGSGTTIAASAVVSHFSLQVYVSSGSPTSWSVVLEGSNNGITFTTILSHNNIDDTIGKTVFTQASEYPCRYFRSRCISVALNTAPAIIAVVSATN